MVTNVNNEMGSAEAYLVANDGLETLSARSKPVFVHNSHRWVLPLVVQAQDDGLLPRPCTAVVFDRHHDALVPDALEKVKAIAESGVTVEAVIDLCANDLSALNDDWVIAGVELGLFKDVVIFGVEDPDNDHDPKGTWKHKGYRDHRAEYHTIRAIWSTPGEMLGFQGQLSDLARKDSLNPLWRALGWENQTGGFDFRGDAGAILLDIDLDCFSVEVRGCTVVWPDEVFDKAFKTPGYGAATRWDGQRFFGELVKRAGVITVAREPECCGGQRICKRIWHKVAGMLGVQPNS